jgi:hypothetical protein
MNLQAFEIKADELASAVRRATRRAAQRIVSIASRPVFHYSRWALYPQAILVAFALIWFEYRPDWATQGPSVAMAFLAVAAIIMAVRGPNSTLSEGVVWIVISCSLFAVEMRSIAVEQKNHDLEQAELRRREESTRREQNQSFAHLITDGEHFLKALGEEKALTAKNLEHITGGDEYCWVAPMLPLPVGAGGNPAYQGNNWWQLWLKNSGKVVLPTCDLRFMPFPTEQEIKEHSIPSLSLLSYHFEKIRVMGRPYFLATPYYIKGDRTYSGVIETPTRSFIEVIKFEPDPNDPTHYVPTCTVSAPSERILEKDCNPQ